MNNEFRKQMFGEKHTERTHEGGEHTHNPTQHAVRPQYDPKGNGHARSVIINAFTFKRGRRRQDDPIKHIVSAVVLLAGTPICDPFEPTHFLNEKKKAKNKKRSHHKNPCTLRHAQRPRRNEDHKVRIGAFPSDSSLFGIWGIRGIRGMQYILESQQSSEKRNSTY